MTSIIFSSSPLTMCHSSSLSPVLLTDTTVPQGKQIPSKVSTDYFVLKRAPYLSKAISSHFR